jgi:hypothetical protein
MQEFHIITENPSGSNLYTPTGEVIYTNVADAVARCVDLTTQSSGDKFGCWVYESIDANALLPIGGIGAEGGGTRGALITRIETPDAIMTPINVDVPYASQTGATLTCTMGNWQNEPALYSYQWLLNGANVGEASRTADYAVQPADVGKSATCIVTAGNKAGQATAPPSNAVVVA